MELKITIEDVEKKTISARWRENGEKGELRGKLLFDPLILRTIKIFRDWLSQGKTLESEVLEVLGSLLYNMLFGEEDGEIGPLLERAFGDAKRNKKLRLKLQFDQDASELVGLPWEYLYMPEIGFLSTKANLVLSRWVPLKDELGDEETREERLRVLLVVSEPEKDRDGQDMTPVGASKIILHMQKISKNYNIELTELDEPTLKNVQAAINGDKPPHVLHFIGHGRVKKAEHRKGEIALLNEDLRTVYWCPETDFAENLGQVGVRVVFLQLCKNPYVNPQRFHASFIGLAPQLIRANVPAVVATQFPISDSDAQTFIRDFYRQLAMGEPVDSAVQEGRQSIRDRESTRFGTPVLFFQKPGGVVKPLKRKPGSRGGSERLSEEPLTKREQINKLLDRQDLPADVMEMLKNLNSGQ